MIKEFLKKYKSYLVSVTIALGVGGLSALLTMKNMDMFDIIKKPPLSPPAWLFPIIWTVLYILMGISAAIIYEKRNVSPERVREALTTYASSLIVNFAWSIIFFNLQAFFIALIWLLLLLFLVILTVIKYYFIDKKAAFLQIPYTIWVTFAAYLTAAITLLN